MTLNEEIKDLKNKSFEIRQHAIDICFHSIKKLAESILDDEDLNRVLINQVSSYSLIQACDIYFRYRNEYKD